MSINIYKAPVDENSKPYWVPIVVKNKDYLIGFLDGMEITMAAFNIDEGIGLPLGSERFNDILQDGRRIRDITEDDFKEYVKSLIYKAQEKEAYNQVHPDGDSDVLDYYLPLSCTCGNFYGFNSSLNIPDGDLICDICDRVLINYTNVSDSNFSYDGEHFDISEIINEVKESLGFDDDDDESSLF